MDSEWRSLTQMTMHPKRTRETSLGQKQLDQTQLDQIQPADPIASAPLFLEQFLQIVHQFPRSVAVRDADTALSYARLCEQAQHLAKVLLHGGVKPGDLVGVALPRNAHMSVALLGVWMAGATYVPLDPDYPSDRLAFMISHSGMTWVLTEPDIQAAVPSADSVRVLLFSSLLADAGVDVELPACQADLPAYVIYTSGSTGKPKGVTISHANLACFLASMALTPGLSRDDVFLGITTLSFDMSVPEQFLPFWVGATLVVLTRQNVTDGMALSDAIDQFGVTVMQGTPTTWRLLLANGWQGRRSMRILIGGEAVPLDLVQALLPLSAAVWNMYGPTETTVWTTCEPLSAPLTAVSIGRPLANARVYVVDERGQRLPPGVAGELWIGGYSVATGYWREPELTAQRFIADPFYPTGRLYKTGDCVRLWADGRLEFLHRMDAQVKVRGYRIELGEVEAGLLSWPEVRAATANVVDDNTGNARLVAYFVAKSGVDLHALRKHLAARLPVYMLPSHYVQLEALPLTPSGKIDRKALPPPAFPSHYNDLHYVPPVTATERALQPLWEQLLKQEPVSVEDGFFELGGHSLLAVKLIRSIHQDFGVDLPLSALFQHPNIRALAALIDAKQKAVAHPQFTAGASWQCLVPLRDVGQHAPLFCFHPVGGNVLHYQTLVARLPDEWPVYGLQAQGLDGVTRPSDNLAEMADHYLSEIIALQPSGSYWLAGGSFGGLLALEVAKRLVAQGRSVACVIMFDTLGPKQLDVAASRLEQRRYDNLLDQAAHSVWTRLRDSARYLLCRAANASGQRIPHVLRYWWVEFNNRKALEDYFSHSIARTPYQGRVAIMRLPMADHGVYSLPHLGWDGILTGEVLVRLVEGDHAKFIESAGFADALTALMRQLDLS